MYVKEGDSTDRKLNKENIIHNANKSLILIFLIKFFMDK